MVKFKHYKLSNRILTICTFLKEKNSFYYFSFQYAIFKSTHDLRQWNRKDGNAIAYRKLCEDPLMVKILKTDVIDINHHFLSLLALIGIEADILDSAKLSDKIIDEVVGDLQDIIDNEKSKAQEIMFEEVLNNILIG